ncbi:HpcH/HpaI aldolase/citrate lyase family protein [Sulfurimonas sp.]
MSNFPCFKDVDGFKKDVLRDLKEGLFSKTIIHPSQIKLYKVTKEEYEEAQQICESAHAIFSQNGKMAEQTTMFPHAKYITGRAEVYGVKQ